MIADLARPRLRRGTRAVERGRAGARGALRVGAPARSSRSRAGAVHVGALDAMAGLPFRVVAIPGLVEGGYPGVLRPDPFLLDAEREALRPSGCRARRRSGSRRPVAGARRPAQLDLFGDSSARPDRPSWPPPVPAACASRLAPPTARTACSRRAALFHRAFGQASERLILSYPRADARSGRERLPSLFFVAAAAALAGRPWRGAELERMRGRGRPLDAAARGRARRRRARPAARAARAARPRLRDRRRLAFFKQSRLARAGALVEPAHALRRPRRRRARRSAARARLDPLQARPSRLRQPARHLRALRLPVPAAVRAAPASPRWSPRSAGGSSRSSAATCSTRWPSASCASGATRASCRSGTTRRRASGCWSWRDEALGRARRGQPAALHAALGAGAARASTTRCCSGWRARRAAAGRATPAHFEVGFGLARAARRGEPHEPEPLVIDLGDGRVLRVSGKIDRIDRRADGTLVLRDYKTGRAPRGRRRRLPRRASSSRSRSTCWPPRSCSPASAWWSAFLDYVDGGRQVAFDPAARHAATTFQRAAARAGRR